MFAEVVAVAVVIFTICWLLKPGPLSHVPGPRSLPIFGSSIELEQKHPHISMHEMVKQYGPVFRLNFQGQPSLMVCDYAGIYEVLVSKSADFAGRPRTYLTDVLTDGLAGIVRTDAGPEVQGRRKLIHAFLKQYGTGMTRLENITVTATEDMIQNLIRQSGQPVDVNAILVRCVADVVAIMLIGETFSDDMVVEIQLMIRQITTSTGKSLSTEIINCFPFMRYFGGNQTYKRIMDGVAMKHKLVGKWLSNKPDNGLVNFILSLSEEERTKFQVITSEQRIQVLFEFLFGSLLTTSVTLTMLMNLLCQQSDVQDKLRKELDEVIGDSRAARLSDRAQLPYHTATLLEIGRYASILPLNIPHKTVRETTLHPSGRTISIPVGTEVITHLWSMHHSDEFWQDPFSFDPGRFLDSSGHLVPADHPNRRRVMAFGAGHRGCVGEVFAMSRMFLILSRIVQTFRILPESTLDKQPSCDPRDMIYGSVLLPKPFKVRLEMIQ